MIAEIKKYPLDYKPTTPFSNEEIERNFETDYQTLYNNFVNCDNAAGDNTAANACYSTYQAGYDNLLNNRATALANYQSTFTTLADQTTDPVLKAKYQLIAKNKVSELIEKRITKDVSTELSKTTNDFKDFSGNILLEKVNKSVLGNALENEITANSYDTYGNILQASARGGVITSYIWDYQYKFPIAEVGNAVAEEIAYTSFESDGKGNWVFNGSATLDPTAPAGQRAYSLSAGDITKNLTTGTTYIVTYWKRDGTGSATVNNSNGNSILTRNGWTLYSHEITGASLLIISGSANIDELRLYPRGALMTTYTYTPLVGMTTQSDANNKITYYEYDSFGRLTLLRDQDKNVIKKVCYNYAGQQENCN